MSIGTTAALVAGGLGAAGAIGGSLISANASGTAAEQQANSQEQALQVQQQEFQTAQANQAPFVSAGQSAVGTLMNDLSNGTYGPGSLGPAPTFTAPTLAQAQQTPGYEFTVSQGEQAIDRGAAAAGGAFTGGTLKSLDNYTTGLADSTYNQIFNNALSGYNAAMGTYQAQLAAQNQGFNQISAVAGLGENAAASAGNTGAQAASTLGNTLGQIGNAQAAGTVGTANALTSGLTGATNSATLPLYLAQLQNVQTPQSAPYGMNNPGGLMNGPVYQPNYSNDEIQD
jgi:hypothetical protein